MRIPKGIGFTTTKLPVCGISQLTLQRKCNLPLILRGYASSSGLRGEYIERLYDHNARGFMLRLKTGVFEHDTDLQCMFANFQRYIPRLKGCEIVDILELLHSRTMREGDDGVDLVLLLLCEANQRMIDGKRHVFSLKEMHRLFSVLKHIKFNRPSYLITPQQHAVNPSLVSNKAIRTRFNIVTTNTTTSGGNSNAQSAETFENVANLEDIDSCQYQQDQGKGFPCLHEDADETNLRNLPLHHLFQENYKQVTVPVCEVNVGRAPPYMACRECVRNYGRMLDISGHDHLSLLIVLLGRSILKQSLAIRKKHENAVASYMILSSHLNSTVNSHLLGTIMAHYRTAFMRSRSMRNIAIAIQTAKKCKVCCNWLVSGLISRLSDVGNFEELCANESNTATLLVSLNQIITGIIVANHLPISQPRKKLGINIITYLVDHYEQVFLNEKLNQDIVNSTKGNLKLLVDYLSSKGVDISRLLLECDMEKLEAIVADGKVEYLKDFKTSDLHKQVASVLHTLGIDAKEEVYINPHFCDLVAKRTVVEIDGPYHFNTGLNQR
ncbi:hypothetical protein BgAZ_402350 [Babesia gibsoni]|uniref:RAP domain-containing protein n=1 Tax=Babesia gibsoni TaxID=33632 RepID=A0AAD8LGI8_BABGI|nr:hypothetical protein BgAZ_402350 [Babesia gibsoni]